MTYFFEVVNRYCSQMLKVFFIPCAAGLPIIKNSCISRTNLFPFHEVWYVWKLGTEGVFSFFVFWSTLKVDYLGSRWHFCSSWVVWIVCRCSYYMCYQCAKTSCHSQRAPVLMWNHTVWHSDTHSLLWMISQKLTFLNI